jgi:nitrite reductase/ring-hydroxylating ferredoxin subunit
MLREPLGLQWAAAAVVAGLLVLVAGGLLVWRMSGAPDAPFVSAGQVTAIDPRGAEVVSTTSGSDVLVVRAAGGVTVFTAPDRPVSWCARSRRLESSDGAVWEPDGRLVGGRGESLPRLPVEVNDGVIYVHPDAPSERLPARPETGATPACVP